MGARPQACAISAAEKEVIQSLKPDLLRLGLFFVGLDFLGDKLVEVNVTSPTCLQEINRLHALRLDIKVIEALEARVLRQKNHD